MGTGGPKPDMKEIDETKGSLLDDKFQKIVDRISSVAEDFEDQETPLYKVVGDEEWEVGAQRIVTFNLNKFDFELKRTVEEYRITGEGRNKGLEENLPPKVAMQLRKKSQYDQNWQVVDLEDLF